MYTISCFPKLPVLYDILSMPYGENVIELPMLSHLVYVHTFLLSRASYMYMYALSKCYTLLL